MKQTNEFRPKELAHIQKTLFKKAGYVPRASLNQAFTRSSYSSQYGGRDNEELEFIGDSVLNFYVVKILTDRFGSRDNDHYFCIRLNYHKIDQLKKQLVSNENLARIIDELEFAQYLIVGKTDIQNEIDKQIKPKADLFEAILGAIAVQSRFDEEIVEKAVVGMLSMDSVINDIINTEYRPAGYTLENAITTLKELAEHGEISMPEYRLTGPEYLGYDKDGNPIWGCNCVISNAGISLGVLANSKKKAKKAAAYLALIQYSGYPNEYGPNIRDISWSYKNGKIVQGMAEVANKFEWNEDNRKVQM